ncbi:MAG: rod shape-determining protein MreD [Nitriliruptoraceae bacterium]|nr:rod shape-determining protein MreD [Nitriliruptoraceae bacterium]
MILRSLVLALTILTAVVLQTALFPVLTLAGFRPDLLLLVVLAVALEDGPAAGVRVGGVAGLLHDLLLSQAPLGLGMLVLSAVGYGAGVTRPYLAPGSITAPLLLAFLTGALATGGYGVLAGLLGDDRTTVTLVIQGALSVALYNTLLAPIVLGAVRRLSDRFPLPGSATGD